MGSQICRSGAHWCSGTKTNVGLSGSLLFATAITLATLLGGDLASAQNPMGTLTASALSGDTGDTVTGEILLDNNGDPLSGWSYGVCHDSTVATLLNATSGTTTLTANAGSPPAFNEFLLYDGGYTHAIVVCFAGCPGLAVGTGYQLSTADYEIVGLAPATTPLELCDTLGDPPVSVVVATGPITAPATTNNGEIAILGPTPVYFDLDLSGEIVPYNLSSGTATLTTVATIIETAGNPTPPNGLTTANLTIQFPTPLLTPTAVTPGAGLQALNGGSGPDTFDVTLNATSIDIAIVASNGALDSLVATNLTELLTIDFDADSTILMNSLFGVSAPITWGASNGTVDGPPVGLNLANGSVFFSPVIEYLRADSGDDGMVGLTDVLSTLNFLFTGGSLSCPAAADFNASGSLGLDDVIGTLNFLFTGGGPPAAPYPDCGSDQNAQLECNSFGSCL